MRLNIGCGGDYRAGHVNIDCRPLDRVDKVFDLREIEQHIEKESVEAIVAYDVLEHISHREVRDLLRKLHELLVPNGTIDIRVPDGIACAEEYLSTDRAAALTLDSVVHWRMYGGQDYATNYHYCMFSYSMLRNLLIETGFSVVSDIIREDLNMRVIATK